MGTHETAIVLAVLGAVAITGCAPQEGGPLVGPRTAEGEVVVCAPVTGDARAYFGAALTNRGSADVIVESITGSGDGVASIEYSIDPDGHELGAMTWPVDDGAGYEQALIDRALDPAGVRVAPGQVVGVVVAPRPSSNADDAVVKQTMVTYTSDGRRYREPIVNTYLVHHGDSC